MKIISMVEFINSFKEFIDNGFKIDKEYNKEDDIKERINKVRGETWVNIGHSVETIADYLIQKRELLIADCDTD